MTSAISTRTSTWSVAGTVPKGMEMAAEAARRAASSAVVVTRRADEASATEVIGCSL